jgi:hypothetical protein
VLFKIVQEQNPQMSKDVYNKLQNEISAGRTEFDRNQKKISDLVREYNTHIRKHIVMNAIFHFQTMDAERKLEVQDYMREQSLGKDFIPIIDHVAQMVADKFERKQFAEFDYLQYELSHISTIIIWVLELLLLSIYGYKSVRSYIGSRNSRRNTYGY